MAFLDIIDKIDDNWVVLEKQADPGRDLILLGQNSR